MKLFVTGATGFLGRYTVAEALRRGHAVRAVARAGGDAARYGWDGDVELVRVDLRSRKGLVDSLRGVDCVLHLAAAKTGDVYEQYAGTVVATENLLWAMGEADVKRLVHVSTFSVYDSMKIRSWSVLDENSPIERDALDRDGYAHTKLVQEHLVREHAAKTCCEVVVIRPGIIFGKDNLWNSNLGMQPSARLWIRTGAWGRQPLTYVENCAEAIALAAEKSSATGQTLNVVDDDLPSQRRFAQLLASREAKRPLIFPVSWTVMRCLARSAWMTNKLLLGNRAKVPSLLVPCRLHARIKPLRYSNRKAKDVLEWTPRYGLEEAIDRSLATSPAPPADRVGEDRERSVERTDPRDVRVGYLTGPYPRASVTFIQREVAAVRRCGVHVETFSVRRPAEAEMVGPEQRAGRESTSYLLPASPVDVVRSHLRLLTRRAGAYFSALRLAIATRPPGLKGLLMQAAYFLEAGVLAQRVRAKNLTHLHNHFADASCTVAMLAAALGGFTYSFTMHGPAEFFEPRTWRVDEKIRRALFVACISQFSRSQTMLFAPRERWDRLHVVHCGVDASSYEPVTHEGEGERLLFVGRLAETKGLPILLEALASLRRERQNVLLRVVGDGQDRRSLEALAQRLGVAGNVQFLGYQSQQRVRELLAETDVFVMSSFAEGVPVVLMEAMAAGVPVVASQIAGVPELVEDGVSGFLVPPADAAALAKTVAVLLGDAELRQSFGAAGRAKVQRDFDQNAEGRRLVHVLCEALRGRVAAVRPVVERHDVASSVSPEAPALGTRCALGHAAAGPG